MGYLMLIPIFLSGIVGIYLLCSYFKEYLKGQNIDSLNKNEVKKLRIVVGVVLFISGVTAIIVAFCCKDTVSLFTFVDEIVIKLKVDEIGRIFIIFTSIIWMLVGLYAFKYMEHEGKEKKFYGFYLLTYSVLMAQDMAANLITFYFFYELMTLVSAPLVMHSGEKKSIMAALKYLFFSMFGAYLALFGIAFLYRYCDTLDFIPGGSLNNVLLGNNKTILLIAVFVLIIGFGTKAGMFPLHAWLWAAHPVAPTPASAVLSGVIVKSGVLAIIRSIYYVVGPSFIKGTWVQFVWLIMIIATIFMGSMLAYREKNLKKRLAYSTISQVSYILFGLALFNKVAFTGAILHTVFHAIVKTALFLSAGIFITSTGKKMVDEYKGIGRKMSVSLASYTVVSLSLIGIPPMNGFISKWYLGLGGLQANMSVLGVIGVVVLLVSALLTAGYLLPITIEGFLPGKECNIEKSKEKINKMVVVLSILALMTILMGLFPNVIINYIGKIAMKLV